MPRPFRFAVVARWAAGGRRWRELARRAEGLGYDTLLVTDHLGRQLAPVPAMMAAADATTTLRVGSFVFANDYRNPVLLAKEVATIDAISGGRVDLGLGAGWSVADYRQLGIPYEAPAVRVGRFEEATMLLDRLLRGEVVDHTGTYYRLERARVLPEPVQKPRPPLMIGGGGPRVLRFAARHADIVSFIPPLDARGRPKIATLRERSLAERIALFREAAGRRADEVDLNVWLLDAGVSDGASDLRRAVLTAAKRGANAIAAFPFLLYGSRASLRDLLRERRAQFGINYVSVPGQAMDELAPLVEELRGT